ncbi:MAG: glycosyltransferase family 39 protein [Microthrixaceae bacterium]
MDGTDWLAVLLSLLFIALNIVWLVRERSSFGYTADEARILPRAYQLSIDLRTYGLRGLWVSWTQDPVSPPFLSVLAAPMAFAFDSVVAVVATVNGFLLVLLLSAYRIARDLGGRVAGIVALLVLAAMPGVIWWSRVFEQIVPGSAMWLLTILLVMRSDQFRSMPHRIGAGLALGIALVTRAMLIGFLPVLAVALIIQNLALKRGQRARPVHVAQFVSIATVVAATWWWKAFSFVTEYFRVAGYGHPSYDRATGGFSLRANRWIDELQLTSEVLGGRAPAPAMGALGPHGVLWSLALLGLLGLLTAAATHRHVWSLAGLRTALASSEWFLGVMAVLGFTVLVTSSQDFRGYSLINLPIAVVLVATTFRYRKVRLLAAPLALILVSYLPYSMSPNASWMALVVESQNGLHRSDELWEKHAQTMLDKAAAMSDAEDPPVIAMTSDRQLYNGPVVRMLVLRRSLGIQVLDWKPLAGPNDCEYRKLIDGVVVSDPASAFSVGLPQGDIASIESNLKNCGYRKSGPAMLMPDGGSDTLWWRMNR